MSRMHIQCAHRSGGRGRDSCEKEELEVIIAQSPKMLVHSRYLMPVEIHLHTMISCSVVGTTSRLG